MTQEEYTQEVKACYSSSQNVDVCEEYIESLEQRILELEVPKTCKLDCAYYDNEYGCQCPFPCTRIKDDDAKDYYEPKEQK